MMSRGAYVDETGWRCLCLHHVTLHTELKNA